MAAARKMLDRVTHQLLSTISTRCIGNLDFFHGEFLIKRGYANALGPPRQNKQMLTDERRLMAIQSDTKQIIDPPARDDDFLGANKLGKQFLINDKQQRVPVEGLRGKIVALYFGFGKRVQFGIREFYTTLKRTKPDSFEMIYVPPDDEEYMDPLIPWLSIPVDDMHWRSYLRQLYDQNHSPVYFIDTRDNKVEVLPSHFANSNISLYGPHFYPFTKERVEQLKEQTIRFGKETSIQAILGSDSRDYLIDRHSKKVRISSLHDKDVLLFHYSSYYTSYRLLERLVEIYNKIQSHSFEIVSINFDHNDGNTKNETLWKDHLEQIPWLHLPFGDEQIWHLRMMVINVVKDGTNPILFIKPKGESLLDPYGFEVFDKFGIQAFPFSRKAAAENLVTRLKGLSFKSYVDEARRLDLDFSSLIRNKANGGGTEHVSLSTILEGEKSRGGILVLFANIGNCSQERLKSLIDVYLRRQDGFEVIFVSMDKDTQSFSEHFSAMPWFALHKPIKRREHMMLGQRTIKIDFNGFSHFLAFGPDQLLLQVGLLTKSFENCEFPFVCDAESAEHATLCINESLEIMREADGTHPYEGDGWWDGLEFDYDDDF